MVFINVISGMSVDLFPHETKHYEHTKSAFSYFPKIYAVVILSSALKHELNVAFSRNLVVVKLRVVVDDSCVAIQNKKRQFYEITDFLIHPRIYVYIYRMSQNGFKPLF